MDAKTKKERRQVLSENTAFVLRGSAKTPKKNVWASPTHTCDPKRVALRVSASQMPDALCNTSRIRVKATSCGPKSKRYGSENLTNQCLKLQIPAEKTNNSEVISELLILLPAMLFTYFYSLRNLSFDLFKCLEFIKKRCRRC